MVTAVFSTAAATCTRAMSPIRRSPCNRPNCPLLMAVNITMPPSAASAHACCVDSNIRRLKGSASAMLATQPKRPVAQTSRRSMRLVRATARGSSLPCPCAMARTALPCKPRPVTVPSRLVVEVYKPITPTPAGPSSTATTFTHNRSTRQLIACAPSTMDDERRIWP